MAKRVKRTLTNWENVPENIDDWYGFLYVITNLKTGQKYIGRKNFHSYTKVKVPGKKRRKSVVKESDWQKYKSSSPYIKEQIKLIGEENLRFEILKTFKTRSGLYYSEVEAQIKNEVLSKKLPNGEYEYYNDNVLNRYYRSRMTFD